MNDLIKKRGIIKGQLSKFETFLSGNVDNPSFLNELLVRLPKAEDLWNKFQDIQEDIEIEDESEDQEEERDNFESNYYRIIGKAKSFLNVTESNSYSSDRH